MKQSKKNLIFVTYYDVWNCFNTVLFLLVSCCHCLKLFSVSDRFLKTNQRINILFHCFICSALFSIFQFCLINSLSLCWNTLWGNSWIGSTLPLWVLNWVLTYFKLLRFAFTNDSLFVHRCQDSELLLLRAFELLLLCLLELGNVNEKSDVNLVSMHSFCILIHYLLGWISFSDICLFSWGFYVCKVLVCLVNIHQFLLHLKDSSGYFKWLNNALFSWSCRYYLP